MEDKSELEYLYSEYCDKLKLPSLKEIRDTISTFYQQNNSSKYSTFPRLAKLINRNFVRLMLRESDFIAPVYLSLALIALACIHLARAGRIEEFEMWPVNFDTISILIIGICLFISAFPFMMASFNRNMQEKNRGTYYLVDMVKLFAAFIALSFFFLSLMSLIGVTDFYISKLFDIRLHKV